MLTLINILILFFIILIVFQLILANKPSLEVFSNSYLLNSIIFVNRLLLILYFFLSFNSFNFLIKFVSFLLNFYSDIN